MTQQVSRSASTTRKRAEKFDPQSERVIKQFMCTAFECWRSCQELICRHHRKCSADPLPCFERYWDSRPDIHAWVIAARRARKSGLSIAEAMRTADREARAGAAAADLPWIADYLGSLKAETQPQSSANKGRTRRRRRRDCP